MKQILSILTLVVFAQLLHAQDDIILRNGEEIKAKVQEVGTGEIKYKRSDNMNGPLYSIWKREVFMIKYENGTKDVFANMNNAGPRDMQGPEFGEHRGGHHIPQDYKGLHHLAVKRIAGGAVMIAVGAPVLLTGVTLTLGGLAGWGNSFDPNTGMVNTGPNGPMVGTGMLLTAAGVALEILGPLTLRKGLKYRRMAKDMQGGTVGFVPIHNPGLDRFSHAMNRQTIGAVTLTF